MKIHNKELRQRRALFLQEETERLLLDQELSPADLIDASAPLSLDNDIPVELEITSALSQYVSQALFQHNGVMIFASAQKPGGGWLNGAIAQEEDVSLLSSWGQQATKAPAGYYGTTDGLGEDNILAAKGLWIIHTDEYLLNPFKPVSFIGVAAPNRRNPAVRDLPKEQLIGHLARRLRTAFDAWHAQNVKVVIGGAIGCGAFQWPANQSAEALFQALRSTAWRGQLILAMPDSNFAQAFEKVLAPLATRPAQPLVTR